MKSFYFMSFLFVSTFLYGQNTSFSIQLQPVSIDGLGGLQSFAFAQHEGKWLILGGRRDGLHRRQPFAAFDLPGHNDQVYVIDPIRQKYWAKSLLDLPTATYEPLKATNTQFHQQDSVLYLLGGYGYSTSESRHITFSTISVIDIPGMMQAVINNQDLFPHIRQTTDSRVQVTGGDLKALGETFFLVGGHKFMGSYNPMGPNHGPGFEQQYTDAVRMFQIHFAGQSVKLDSFASWTNGDYFHRRDFNVVSQIMQDGSEGLTAFSGVFQPNVDLPFLDCINITEAGYQQQQNFSQYFNHYHCPTIPLFDSVHQEMSTLFFGGMAQYYMQGDKKIKDDNVPFVKTITKVSRLSDGTMKEIVLPVEMPGYLGSGAQFIPLETLPAYRNEIVNYHALSDIQALGFIYGGISSNAPNIFFTNDGSQSSASDNLYLVTLVKEKSSQVQNVNPIFHGGLHVSPNPAHEFIKADFTLNQAQTIRWNLYRNDGAAVASGNWPHLTAQNHSLEISLSFDHSPGIYYLELSNGNEKLSAAVMLK